jgi:hypothetical protein
MKLNWFKCFQEKANTLVNLLDADLVTDIAALLDADLYIIAVSDAISAVAAELPLKNRLVVTPQAVWV